MFRTIEAIVDEHGQVRLTEPLQLPRSQRALPSHQQCHGDERAIPIAAEDCASGELRVVSFARPGKLSTAHETLIQLQAGRLANEAFERMRGGVLEIFT